MESQCRQLLPPGEANQTDRDAGVVACGACPPQELAALREELLAVEETAASVPDAARPLRDRPGVWIAVSLALHAVLVWSLASAAVFTPREIAPPEENIVELTLGSLAGPGGSGGDGQLPGGGGASAGAAAEPSAPAQADAPQPAPPQEPPQPVAIADVPVPEAQPTPDPPPQPERKTETPPKPKPRREPKPKPQPRQAKRADAPPAQATGAPTTGAAGATQEQGTVAGAGTGTGTGDAQGQGTGKGPGQGPGPGGYGGEGPGGGGGGEYVGQFGRGDGPTFRHRDLPHYPSEAKRGNQEGKVVLRLTIDAEGLLRDAEVVSHTGLEFAEEALRAIRKSSFFPAKRNGRPVPSKALLAIRFKLE